MFPGRATPEGTARFRDAADAATGHFRRSPEGLSLSSLGIGTYLGGDDAKTDALYAASVRRALQLGINVVDTAINYRNQRSERAVGAALRESALPREGIVLCTKGGYIAFDGARPYDARALVEETFIAKGLLTADDIVAGGDAAQPGRSHAARSRAGGGAHRLRLGQCAAGAAGAAASRSRPRFAPGPGHRRAARAAVRPQHAGDRLRAGRDEDARPRGRERRAREGRAGRASGVPLRSETALSDVAWRIDNYFVSLPD